MGLRRLAELLFKRGLSSHGRIGAFLKDGLKKQTLSLLVQTSRSNGPILTLSDPVCED